MAVIVVREIPHNKDPIDIETRYKIPFSVNSRAIKMGWAMRPTRKSETAKLQSIIMCVERMEGVLIMAANTKALPRMDMSISGALRTQFMMIIVSGVELSSLSEWWSADPSLCVSVMFIINFWPLVLSNCLYDQAILLFNSAKSTRKRWLNSRDAQHCESDAA